LVYANTNFTTKGGRLMPLRTPVFELIAIGGFFIIVMGLVLYFAIIDRK